MPIISFDRTFNDDILDDSYSVGIDFENIEDLYLTMERFSKDKEFVRL